MIPPPDLYLDDVPNHGELSTAACSTAGAFCSVPSPGIPLNISFALHCLLVPESTAA